jgi:FkbM family methyltransferase
MSETTPRPHSPALRAYRFLNRPYYWFRPQQLLTRLRAPQPPSDGTPGLVRTAWGSQLYCWADSLGLAVARNGVYDLVVAETLARLADRGETAVDAGANVGLMSNLLAHAVGERGRVISFEAHPLIQQTIARNVALWAAEDGLGPVDLRRVAVSSARGALPLSFDPETFAYNKGTATLQASGSGSAGAGADGGAGGPDADGPAAGMSTIEVQTVRLDEELQGPIGVLKLDVEMHEREALEGAASLLSERQIRDIVFEEHEPPPTEVTRLLASRGFTILGVRQGLAGPILSEPAEAYRRQLWDPPALLATLDPERASRRLRRRGWVCLGRRLRRAGA